MTGCLPDTDEFALSRVNGTTFALTAHRVARDTGPAIWLVSPESVAAIAQSRFQIGDSIVDTLTPEWL